MQTCFTAQNICLGALSRTPSPHSITMKSKGPRAKRPRSKNSESHSSNSGKAPEPARINVDSSTPSLRMQLKALRAARSASSTGQNEAPRTRYRRTKADADVWASQQAARAGDATIPAGKYSLGARPLCYIDGYNVIGAWSRLTKHRNRGDLETARRLLLEDVGEFAHLRDWECVAVFDACNTDREVNSDFTDHNVQIVFTGTSTADTFIERAVFIECERGSRPVYAVTSDAALQTFTSAKGAHRLSARLFVQELKAARRQLSLATQQNDHGSTYASKMLQSSVDEETRAKLFELRTSLDK